MNIILLIHLLILLSKVFCSSQFEPSYTEKMWSAVHSKCLYSKKILVNVQFKSHQNELIISHLT